MLAFFDSPVQLLIVGIVVLIVFGPQKLPEIANQLGRALRELKRSTSDLTGAFNVDDHHDTTYNPPKYDSYGNSYEAHSTASIPESDVWHAPALEAKSYSGATEAPHGDFAAAAFADHGDGHVENTGGTENREPAEPVYGVLAPPLKAVARTEEGAGNGPAT